MSDTPREEPHAIAVDRRVNARHLSRRTAALLREVGFEGRSFAVEHFGRVVGFLVPAEGRVPVRRGRKIVYEVPGPEPLLELTDLQVEILRILRDRGEAAPDRLAPPDGDVHETLAALADLEFGKPRLISKSWMGYRLTPAGTRHVEELGI